jgi:hypothetical protein
MELIPIQAPTVGMQGVNPPHQNQIGLVLIIWEARKTEGKNGCQFPWHMANIGWGANIRCAKGTGKPLSKGNF